MYTIDILLLVIKGEGENGLQGRTLLQKKVYFLSVLMGVRLDFSAHYYGPEESLLFIGADGSSFRLLRTLLGLIVVWWRDI